MIVYCVFGYPDVGDYTDNYTLLKIFAQKAEAEKYMQEQNKKSGWNRIVRVDEEEVN